VRCLSLKSWGLEKVRHHSTVYKFVFHFSMSFPIKTGIYTYTPLTASTAPLMLQGSSFCADMNWITALVHAVRLGLVQFSLALCLSLHPSSQNSKLQHLSRQPLIIPDLLMKKEILSDMGANDDAPCRPNQITQGYFLAPGLPSTALLAFAQRFCSDIWGDDAAQYRLHSTPTVWETKPQPTQPFGLSGVPW